MLRKIALALWIAFFSFLGGAAFQFFFAVRQANSKLDIPDTIYAHNFQVVSSSGQPAAVFGIHPQQGYAFLTLNYQDFHTDIFPGCGVMTFGRVPYGLPNDAVATEMYRKLYSGRAK